MSLFTKVTGKSPPDLFAALMQEWVFGKVSEEEVAERYRLTDVERAELRALYNAIRIGAPELHGSTPSERAKEVGAVLFLYTFAVDPYVSEEAVRRRFGL